jgi:3-hydroxyisobutyrate dehydrogenase
VVFGDFGVIHGMTEGDILVDHSTISPSATKDFSVRAAELGVTWLDAPVSGGSEGAEQGTLAVMVGGPEATLDVVRPFMEAYSKSIVHVGEEPGSGQMAKAVNQVLVVLNQLAASEALLLAQGAGLDLTMTLEAVEGGAAGSWMLSNRGPQMIRRDWRPGFTIDLQQKDLRARVGRRAGCPHARGLARVPAVPGPTGARFGVGGQSRAGQGTRGAGRDPDRGLSSRIRHLSPVHGIEL